MKRIKNFEAVTYYYRIMPYITMLPSRRYIGKVINRAYDLNAFLGENWAATIRI